MQSVPQPGEGRSSELSQGIASRCTPDPQVPLFRLGVALIPAATVAVFAAFPGAAATAQSAGAWLEAQPLWFCKLFAIMTIGWNLYEAAIHVPTAYQLATARAFSRVRFLRIVTLEPKYSDVELTPPMFQFLNILDIAGFVALVLALGAAPTILLVVIGGHVGVSLLSIVDHRCFVTLYLMDPTAHPVLSILGRLRRAGVFCFRCMRVVFVLTDTSCRLVFCLLVFQRWL